MNISLTTCQEYEIAFEAKKGIKNGMFDTMTQKDTLFCDK